jgi:hypothetical protein
MIDLTEEAHASTSVKGSAKKEEVASADVLQPKPHQASNSVALKDSTVSYCRRDTSTKRSADPSFFPSELISYIRENTLFSFINSSHEVSRTRRFDTCDTAGRLFLQADVGGLVRRSDEEAALSLTIPGYSRLLVIPNKDENSFKELVDAITDAQCWQKGQEGQESAACTVEVGRYG